MVVTIADGVELGAGRLCLIAGPCVIESEDHVLTMAEAIAATAARFDLGYVFKASFDKANRTSIESYRGPGLEAGLAILERVRREIGCPVTTDVHEAAQARVAGQVVDLLQIPAFLCRQTDLLVAAGETGRAVNIKKAQFLEPSGMRHVVAKLRSTGNSSVAVTERGSCFGYGNLVVDMRGLLIMREACDCPVIMDATHAVQLPGAGDGCSGGDRRFIRPLARAAAAIGVDGLFLEVHDAPDEALSDGPNALPLTDLPGLLEEVLPAYEIGRKARRA